MSRGLLRLGPIGLLGLLTLLLAAGLAWLWFDSLGQVRNTTWVAPKALMPDIKVPAGAAQPRSIAGNQTSFAVILERPLFAPDRRLPPPPPPPTPPPPPDPLANTQILGIFSGASSGILARVDGKLRRVKVGETIGPWALKSVDGRDATFAQGDNRRQLHLAYARLDAAVAVPAPAPPNTQAPRPTPGPISAQQNPQDVVRERLKGLNEYRASVGLPPLER